MLHGPGNIGSVLLGFHSKDCDTGRPPLELWLRFKRVSIGSPRQKRVSEKIVEGHVAELVLVVWKPCVTGVCPRRVGVGRHTGGRVTWHHAWRDHRTSTRVSCPQVVLNLEHRKQQIWHWRVLAFVPLLLWHCICYSLWAVHCLLPMGGLSLHSEYVKWLLKNNYLKDSSNLFYCNRSPKPTYLTTWNTLKTCQSLEYSFYSHNF